jgi:hypothetical protein
LEAHNYGHDSCSDRLGYDRPALFSISRLREYSDSSPCPSLRRRFRIIRLQTGTSPPTV